MSQLQPRNIELSVTILFNPTATAGRWAEVLRSHTETFTSAVRSQDACLVQRFSFRAGGLTRSIWKKMKAEEIFREAYDGMLGEMAEFLRVCRNLRAITVQCARVDERVARALQSLPAVSEVDITSSRIPWDVSRLPFKVGSLSLSCPEDEPSAIPCFFSGGSIVSLNVQDEPCIIRVLEHLRAEHSRLGSLNLVHLRIEITEHLLGPILQLLPLCTRLKTLHIDDYRYRHPSSSPTPQIDTLSSLPPLNSYFGPSDIARVTALRPLVQSLTITSRVERTKDALAILPLINPSPPVRPSVRLLQPFMLDEFPSALKSSAEYLDRVASLQLRFATHDGLAPELYSRHAMVKWEPDSFPGYYICQVLSKA